MEIVDGFEDSDVAARVFYPGEGAEGARIHLTKGMNAVHLSEAIHHEIGHLLDWYLTGGSQSSDVVCRERDAIEIGERIRFHESS